jgi:hypothetical protein
MENAPVINLSFVDYAPEIDLEIYERFQNWIREAYIPISMKNPNVTGFDHFQILKESLEYPRNGTFAHCNDLEGYQKYFNSPDYVAIRKDREQWNERGVREPVWNVCYEIIKSYRNGSGLQGGHLNITIDNTSIMHLEAFRLSQDNQEKYFKWFSSFGYDFIPLFTKLRGLKGYDCYKDTGYRSYVARENDYPIYLSVVYFEDFKSFEAYVNSQELVIFRKSLRTVFPNGLNYKWYVQYQLIKSWRK